MFKGLLFAHCDTRRSSSLALSFLYPALEIALQWMFTEYMVILFSQIQVLTPRDSDTFTQLLILSKTYFVMDLPTHIL